MDLALNFDQLTFLLKLLNPDADIRKIDPRFNHGENILFSKIPGNRLIIPFGYHYTKKEGITNKNKNEEEYFTTCKIYSHTKAIKMGKILEQKEEIRKKPAIKKAYVYKDENNERTVCVCYNYGYKIAHKNEFIDLLQEFGKQKNKKTIKAILEDEDVVIGVPKSFVDKLIKNIVPFDVNNYYNVNNFYINFNKANLLKKEYLIIKSKTLMGKSKKKNTDSSLILSHPLDKNTKLLAVADSDEIEAIITPSVTAIDELKNWFNTLELSTLEDSNELITKLQEKIYNINCILYNIGYRNNKPNSTITTLTIAMILKNNTIIASIGNSKAYILKDKNIHILTDKKDKTNKLGESSPYNLYINNIKNTDYDKLLLLTDGVIYSLSDKIIEFIANTTNKEDIANEIVEAAVGDYDDKTCGKDNATAIAYIKK